MNLVDLSWSLLQLEVVNEPDLFLAVVCSKLDPSASEHEICQLNQVNILIDKRLDPVSILIEGRDEELFEVDELIHILKSVGQIRVKFAWGCLTHFDLLPLKDGHLGLADYLGSHLFVEI